MIVCFMCLLVILLTVNQNYKDVIGGCLMDNYEYIVNFISKKIMSQDTDVDVYCNYHYLGPSQGTVVGALPPSLHTCSIHIRPVPSCC